MKVLIVASCILAVVSAGYVGQSTYGYPHVTYQAAHIPVLDHNGYQLDTPEVAHAKAAHFAAHADANARTGHGLYAAAPLAYAGNYASHYGGIHIPVIGPNGVPLDTPEVAAGKVANAVAHAEAHARNGDHHAVIAPIAAHGYVAGPVAVAHGLPIDTAEVAHAKAAHFAAHVEARARNGHGLIHYRKRRGLIASPVYAHAYAQHIPVIGPNGVPLETPEVVAAKAHHAAAHVEAVARNGDLHLTAPVAYTAHGIAAHGIAAHGLVAPVAYAHGHYAYAGPQHLPVIGPNGVPLDTPEVAAGKVANAVAHAEAHARNGDLHIAPLAYASHGIAAHGVVAPLAIAHSHHIPVIGHNGVPLDTPEVAAAKVHHAAAHVEAKARNGDLLHYY